MIKRLFDIVVGTLLSLVFLPIIVVLAIGVCLSLRTVRPFFVQSRIRSHGRYFRIVKLRTLPRDVPPYALRSAVADVPLTRFTKFLRQRHLDELPQITLVPIGILSMVGPRPKMPDTIEPVDPTYGTMRLMMAQGCTGLWQISCHRNQMPDTAPQYDIFYLEHATVRLDMWILWRTGLLILGLAGPVDLGDIPRWTRRREAPRLRSPTLDVNEGGRGGAEPRAASELHPAG